MFKSLQLWFITLYHNLDKPYSGFNSHSIQSASFLTRMQVCIQLMWNFDFVRANLVSNLLPTLTLLALFLINVFFDCCSVGFVYILFSLPL